jgi:hypothetical protein
VQGPYSQRPALQALGDEERQMSKSRRSFNGTEDSERHRSRYRELGKDAELEKAQRGWIAMELTELFQLP